jgi:hypothetical protein
MCYCFNGIRAHKNPQKILSSIEANCTRDLMHLKLNTGRQFKGMLFAKGFMDECNSRAGSNLLTLPLHACGVKSKMLTKDIMQYSVQIIVQHSSKLQQKSDVLVNAKCDVKMMDYNIDNHVEKTQRNGRMRFFKPSSTKIRSWLVIDSAKMEYAVVGEDARLSAIAIVPRSIGIRVIDCMAYDGVGDSSQKLFDENGCAVDDLIMAEFEETITNVEDGWSKSHDDDVVKKVFSASKYFLSLFFSLLIF